tara:strand:- start:1776 stop:1949 length:174 start_codon:yes stop_codon:yes gene_type:complete
MNPLHLTLINIYLDYLNNYVSSITYARANSLSINQARMLIDLGRELNEEYAQLKLSL